MSRQNSVETLVTAHGLPDVRLTERAGERLRTAGTAID